MNQSDFMRTALDEAKKGLGRVHPNPPVGCVIVCSKGNIIGRGAHLEFGGPHAEVNALQSVQDASLLEGASLYVTLEPCAHEAKTPSCAKTLSKLPIKKLVYAVQDPNPKVSGKGAQILRDAGIEVEELNDPKLREECEALAEIFFWNMRHDQVFVSLKAATSLNGSLTPDEKTKWLTGEESREHVHFLRSQYDAVAVGVDTFLKDDPKLNIRLKSGGEKENFAIVLDPTGRGLKSLSKSELAKCRTLNKIVWVVSEKVSYEGPIQIMNVANTESGLDLKDFLQQLWKLEIRSVFIEGGAKTYGQFINQGLVNRIYHYTSPNNVSEANMLNWLSYVKSEISAKGPITKLTFGTDQFESFLVRS